MNKSWLAKKILETLTPNSPQIGQFFNKLDSAIKLYIPPKEVNLADKMDLIFQNPARVCYWNPILASLVWLEGTLPSTHSLIFCDNETRKLLDSELSPFDVQFGLLVEMLVRGEGGGATQDGPGSYYGYKINLVSALGGISFCPLAIIINLLSEEKLEWEIIRSDYIPPGFWDSPISQDVIPIAERVMSQLGPFFIGLLAIIGGWEIDNWEEIKLLIN